MGGLLSFMDDAAMGDDGISRDEFYRAIQGLATAMDSGFAQTHTRLDRLNSKTEKHGNDITRIDAVMEERDKAATRDTAARWGALAAGVAAIIAAVWEWISK
jgi:hypothetical protein